MEENKTPTPDSSALARLFRLGEDASEIWESDEMAWVFRHQLDAPLSVDLPPQALEETETARGRQGSDEEPPRTFRGLFEHANPPLELLERVKGFAKETGGRKEASLPREIAAVLYLVAIAAALVRRGDKITHLDDAALTDRFQWALGHRWLDATTRTLLEQAISYLSREKE